MQSSWLSLADPFLLTGLAGIAVMVAYAFFGLRQGQEMLDRGPSRDLASHGDPEPVVYNLDLPAPDGAADHELILSCPHCGFSGPMDDPSAVGETVDCPLCEESFLVLEPDTSANHAIAQ